MNLAHFIKQKARKEHFLIQITILTSSMELTDISATRLLANIGT